MADNSANDLHTKYVAHSKQEKELQHLNESPPNSQKQGHNKHFVQIKSQKRAHCVVSSGSLKSTSSQGNPSGRSVGPTPPPSLVIPQETLLPKDESEGFELMAAVEKDDETLIDTSVRAHLESNNKSLACAEMSGGDRGDFESAPPDSTPNRESNHKRRKLWNKQKPSTSVMRILEQMTTSIEFADSGNFAVSPPLNGLSSSEFRCERIPEERRESYENWMVDTFRAAGGSISWSRDADEFIKAIIEREFPDMADPTARDVINTGTFRENGALYCPGDWVETRGPDMQWRLEMITRVVKLAPDDFDWNSTMNEGKMPKWRYFYSAGKQRMLEADELRSPKEGLLRVFGARPWVWQQWACLQLEHRIRFQKGHQFDFASIDVQKSAADLWDRWLHNPANSDFLEVYNDDRIGDFGRCELVNHIMKPFKLVDKIKEKDYWDFSGDRNISVFTYLSVIGSGYFIPCMVTLLQVFIPIVLILNVARSSGEKLEFLGYFGRESAEDDMSKIAQAMAVLVLTFYFIKVVPDTLVSFFNTVGTAETVYSRLLSLRQELWVQHDDRFGQKVGYKMDLYMNTAYVSFLYMLNILIIMNTNDAFEIILNALAFEFVIRLDEEFTASAWWDPEKRWITAGAMELVLQNTLRLSWLSSLDNFSAEYNIPKDLLSKLTGNDSNLLKNETIARRDINDPQYMTNDELVRFRCRQAALGMKNQNAIYEYQKPVVVFGLPERIARPFLPISATSIFDRYGKYRVWSLWEKVLFLSPVPHLEEIFETDENGNTKVSESLSLIRSTKQQPFANFHAGQRDYGRKAFLKNYFDVVMLKHTRRGMRSALIQGQYGGFVFRLLDSLLQWASYIVQVVFPLYTIVCLFAVLADLLIN